MATECSNRSHSASFPVTLPRWFIKLFTAENDLVLDPFMGSGTTALACMELDRRYVGIEAMKEYVDLARDAIEEKRNEPRKNGHRRTRTTNQQLSPRLL